MTFEPLPDIKSQLTDQYYRPIEKDMAHLRLNMREKFDEAVKRYEDDHGHKFPYSFPTWCRAFYDSIK